MSYPCGVPLQGSNTAEHAWTANLSGICDYRSPRQHERLDDGAVSPFAAAQSSGGSIA
jgi:hypothetical protein